MFYAGGITMINKIAIAGCGNVGAALLELLHEKRAELKSKYGFEYIVTLISGRPKGTVMNPDGLNIEEIIDELRENGSFKKFPQASGSFSELLEKSGATILAEATPTDLTTGEPGLSHVMSAREMGVKVTTTNKGPIALKFSELNLAAEKSGAKLRYEGVIMAGTPVINGVTAGLAGCEIQKAEGILNGTTNFILTKMAEGKTYLSALTEATELGYAEADPTGDVEGWDAAVKVSIMAKIFFNKDMPVSEIDRTGITAITSEDIDAAGKTSCAIKLIAGIKNDNGKLSGYVKPMKVPFSAPLASINGAVNALTVTTDNLGDVTFIGAGAGRRETAQALLADIIAMVR